MHLEDAGAIVAGGASGLGEATARALHARGATVTIADLNAEKGEALAGELGERAAFARCDVTNEEEVSAAVSQAAQSGGPLRVSVCCAGVGWAERTASKRGPHQLQPFETVIRINLIGTFNVLRFAAAAMNDNEPTEGGERGVCINTASIAAFDGQIGQIAYSASKGGIVGLTLPAARDLASRGIRVVTIAPGTVRHAVARCAAAGSPRRAREGDPVPAATRAARRVRGAGRSHRRQPDAERRGDQARRRPADAAALSLR